MLIAISGSQGTGKSTLIDALSSTHKINPVTRKTSRSILKDWNVTLDEVNSDLDLTVKFQDEILKRKMQDEMPGRGFESVWVTERTFSDLFVYSLIVLGKHNKYSDWLNEYYTKCKRANEAYSLTFYLPSNQFPLEHDGTRGSNEHYSKMVALTLAHYTPPMSWSPSSVTVMKPVDINERISIIKTTLQLSFQKDI